jgi:hypothetical protein
MATIPDDRLESCRISTERVALLITIAPALVATLVFNAPASKRVAVVPVVKFVRSVSAVLITPVSRADCAI